MTNYLFAQLESVARLVDHAAEQDMRWWFLGALLAAGMAIIVLARYCADRFSRLSNRLEQVQDQRTTYLEKNGATLVATIADNAAAMREFSQAVSAVEHLFEPPATPRA